MSNTAPDTNRKKNSGDETRPEYDFSAGTRGKHFRAYRQGHTVTIHHADGSTTVRHVEPDDGAIFLDPDVRTYFPDSESVNNALRGLIELVPGGNKQ